MTNMELLELFGEARSTYIQEAQALRMQTLPVQKKRLSTRKLWILIAAVVAILALSLTAYAAIHARIRLQMTHAEAPTPEDRITLSSIYPQSIPEGYQLLSGSTNAANVRQLYYWKDSGTEITFALSLEQDLRDIPLSPSGQKTEITVAGNAAILYEMDSDRWILWKNTEAGYTAWLHTNDSAVNLPAMAESVAAGDALPEIISRTETGLWLPHQLPQGFSVREVTPMSNGIRSIDYVRITENREIEGIQYTISVARDLSDIGQAPHSTMTWEDVDLQGTPGRMVTIGDAQRLLFWKNEAEGFNAMLMTTVMDTDLAAIAASVGPGQWPETSPMYLQQPEYSVQMEQDNTYVAFEPWYPQAVPDGYAINYISEKMYGEQAIRYTNADGDEIRYILYYRLGNWPRGYEGDQAPEEVSINGIPGYLVKTPESAALYWVNEEKGFGFILRAGSDVDILTMARSVAPGPELPATDADKTAAALHQLGDYRITALPDGMQEDGTAGWPRENADDWYSYVRRRYINPATNQQISMEYSTFGPQDSSLQDLACAIAGENAQPAKICGQIGACSAYEGHSRIVWLDESMGLSFELFSNDFSITDLMIFAQSVQRVTD